MKAEDLCRDRIEKPAAFRSGLRKAGCLFIMTLLVCAAVQGQPATTATPGSASFTNYHSWSNAVSLQNGIVEVLIVPSIGRVQQFRFVGDADGAFWEDPRMFGRGPSGFYANFGGDKAWPSPQSEWGWPPPKGFDGSTNSASLENSRVILATPVDTRYGIKTTRVIELVPGQPVMRIRTVFERTQAASKTNALGIWIDCQATVTQESRCYVPVPATSIYPTGFTTNGSSAYTPALPAGFTHANGLISFGPDSTNHKLGFDGGILVLVGPALSLRMDAPRVPGAVYPDGNASTEVYTAGSRYFELEMMGPLTELPLGGRMEFVTTYSLFRRTESASDAEAQKVLSWNP